MRRTYRAATSALVSALVSARPAAVGQDAEMAVAHLTHQPGQGLDLYHEFHGFEDGPRVLNIGGSGGDLRRTFPASHPMNRHFRVLSYDQRGLGRSSCPDVDATMADFADDAAALIEHAGWERCHVYGTSFGGMVALHLALRHPHLIDRLVLNCTSPGGDHPSYPLHEIVDTDPDEVFALRMRLNDSRWDPAADEPTPGLGQLYELIARQARSTPPPDVAVGLNRQLAARAGHDVEARLTEIPHPTLVCAGRYDATAPMANSEILAEMIPDARLHVFEGGHLFFLQDSKAHPAAIDFLQNGHPSS